MKSSDMQRREGIESLSIFYCAAVVAALLGRKRFWVQSAAPATTNGVTRLQCIATHDAKTRRRRHWRHTSTCRAPIASTCAWPRAKASAKHQRGTALASQVGIRTVEESAPLPPPLPPPTRKALLSCVRTKLTTDNRTPAREDKESSGTPRGPSAPCRQRPTHLNTCFDCR